MNSYSDRKPKFDPLRLIGQAFAYAKHIRLMILMGAFGLTCGLVYFLFSVPTYRATSLVYVQGFGAPMANRQVPETLEMASFNRAFLTRFRSQRVQLAAAKKLGLVGDDATFENVIPHVPQVIAYPIDSRHLEVAILAYDPAVVRTFTEAMVEEFQRLQEESWKEYRDEALLRYAQQVTELEKRISESIESMTKVEREQNLTEATLEQQSLMEIPKRLIQTRERIAQMKGLKGLIEKLEDPDQAPGRPVSANSDHQMGNIVALLSLLDKFEDDTAVAVGDVVSTTGPRDGVIAGNNAPGVVVEPSSVDGIEEWRKLEKQKRILEDEIAVSAKTYLPDHQVMKDLTASLEDTRRKLFTELRVLREKFDLEYISLQEKEKILDARMPEYFAITEKVGKSAYAFSSIADQQRMWDRAREQLSQKLASITFSEDFDWIQVRYKGHINLRDEIPISPSKSKLAMLSLIIALAGAIGVPTLLNLFDTSANNVPQLEESTGLNGIGIVPLTSRDFLEEVHRSPAQGATIPNYLLECFRVIRSNICLHPNHRDRSQVVLVTSARPQEGKTTQAANLAWAFHSMGEKTLLIDCDLRRGRIHELLKIDKGPGVTRLLLGEVSPEEAIVNTGLEGFDALPRGPVIAGTTEILCQRPFDGLIERFRESYDRIVIDSPPVLGLSESSSLQRIVDGTVLVVRAERTARKDVLDAITVLKKSSAHFFGFVLNAVDLSKASNYYYYYYYSAPYYDQFEAEEAPREPRGRRHSTHQPSVAAATPADPEIHELLRRP